MLRLKRNYVSHTFGGEHLTVGAGRDAFSGVIRANASAALLMEALSAGAEEAELTALLTERYAVSEETAARDVGELLETLRSIDAIETVEN